MNLKRLIVPGLIAGAIAVALTMPIGADDGVIQTSVTPLVLSVSVNETIVDYGALPLSVADDTRSKKISQAITATNNGSVTSNLRIRGSDATSAVQGNTTWTLNCDISSIHGIVGNNQYVHRFDTPDYEFDGGGLTLCSGVNDSKLLAASIGTTATAEFKLQMNMPTASTGYATRSSTVTVIAVAP